jgi:hypothetical protein
MALGESGANGNIFPPITWSVFVVWPASRFRGLRIVLPSVLLWIANSPRRLVAMSAILLGPNLINPAVMLQNDLYAPHGLVLEQFYFVYRYLVESLKD